jgi:hypothetical protein
MRFWHYTLMVLISITIRLSAENRKTILQLFAEIDHPMMAKSLLDPVFKKPQFEKKEIINGTLAGGILTVDIRNHFIEIKGDGGLGPHARQYAQYSPEVDPIFAISRQYSAFNPQDNFIVFLRKQNDKWIDVTSTTFPNLTIESFAEDPTKITGKSMKKLKEFGVFKYPLPQTGTTIVAEFDLDWYNWVNQGEATYKEGDLLLSPITYKFIRLKWQKESRKFEIADYIKRSARKS